MRHSCSTKKTIKPGDIKMYIQLSWLLKLDHHIKPLTYFKIRCLFSGIMQLDGNVRHQLLYIPTYSVYILHLLYCMHTHGPSIRPISSLASSTSSDAPTALTSEAGNQNGINKQTSLHTLHSSNHSSLSPQFHILTSVTTKLTVLNVQANK